MQQQTTEKSLLVYVRKQAQEAQQALDAEVAKIPNVCGKGCSACCHQMVYATSWEEELIRHYVESKMFPKVKQVVRKQLVDWWRTFKTMARQSTREAPLTQYEQAEIQRLMRQQRVRCPFLVDDVCSIYPVRPAVCRAHVVANDPSGCAVDPDRNGDARALQPYGQIFGPESTYMPVQKYPHFMKPLSYFVTDLFRLAIPSTPMEAITVGGENLGIGRISAQSK